LVVFKSSFLFRPIDSFFRTNFKRRTCQLKRFVTWLQVN
jgi:hypothetical protein